GRRLAGGILGLLGILRRRLRAAGGAGVDRLAGLGVDVALRGLASRLLLPDLVVHIGARIVCLLGIAQAPHIDGRVAVAPRLLLGGGDLGLVGGRLFTLLPLGGRLGLRPAVVVGDHAIRPARWSV